MSATELRGVCVSFGRRQVLLDVSLSVERGQVVGLMGPNGSGKSTLLRVLVGALAPSSGEGEVCGCELGGRARPRCGYVLEVPPFAEERSGAANLRMLARLGGVPVGEVPCRMAEVGLDPQDRTPVRAYSQGMRKRLGLAQAVMGSPDLLALDEPMNGLDLRGMMVLERVVAREAARGAQVVMTSHDLGGLARMCDVVYAVVGGRALRVRERYLTGEGLAAAYLFLTGDEGREGGDDGCRDRRETSGR